jgi:hypothetical protein
MRVGDIMTRLVVSTTRQHRSRTPQLPWPGTV